MSLNERWRGSKIVEALSPEKKTELIGGLRNALERGETIDKAKKSFENAGYEKAEIEDALSKMQVPGQEAATSAPSSGVPTQNPAQGQTQPIIKRQQTKVLPTQKRPKLKKHLPKILIIIMVIIAIGILAAAIALGFFWDRLF
jgi:hypothetical protein